MQRAAKVPAAAAEIHSMESANDVPFDPGHPRYEEAQALENTVRVIRRAKGKQKPEDFPYGSPGWNKADEEYMLDLLQAMGESLEDLEG